MELKKISTFSRKTPLLFDLIKEYVYYRITIDKKRKLKKKINKILRIVVNKKVIKEFNKELPELKIKLNEDALYAFKCDPSYHNLEETIVTSLGLYAIMVYRVSNILYKNKVEIIPRLLSEHAHSITGIDINPEAEIGRNFFIDHGTGVVIGGTTFIGNNVRLYQGVTLGAKSLNIKEDLRNKKRHPTILNDVTIYANSTILGGETIIGEGSTIGTGKIITESIPEYTKVI